MLRRSILVASTTIALGLVGLTVGARFGVVAFDLVRPETPWFWYFSRAAGVAAYLALALVTLWGLLLSTALADSLIARARSAEIHRWLAAIGLSLAVAHAVALLGDQYIRFDLLDVLLPGLAPYRPAAVALGIVGLYLMIVVSGSFSLRSRIGARTWRALHVLSFPSFALVTLHGIFAGSDGAALWVRFLYLVPTGLVLWLTLFRLLTKALPTAARATRPAGQPSA